MVATVHQDTKIELRRLHRFFGVTRAVDDISFDVYQGEVFGYIGPNGAGKTTSMRILATLDLPTAGDALVDGFSVINDPDHVRRRLGFMPDYFGVYSNVNVYEYLDFFARAYGLVGRERHQSLRHVMSFTGLEELREKPISGLSKGMKQRLCLGRSMVHDPGVLILDEPAAGLDPRARIELRAMIGQLAADGKTVLVSSHILTELAEMCHRVGIIEQGQLLAIGGVEELLAGGSSVQTPAVQITVRVLGGVQRLGEWLEQQFVAPTASDSTLSTVSLGAESIRVDGELLHFEFAGDRESQAGLLKQMIDAGHPLLEFSSRAKSLEDAFLHVTRGVVQ